MDELKPCPFCGGEAEPFKDACFCAEDGTMYEIKWFVGCTDCPALVSGETEVDAIAAWNRRVDNDCT